MRPTITILLSTFNRAHLIGETLTSIQQQTYENWHCIITDDGSTDDTERVVHQFIEDDSRFEYQKKPASYKKGLSDNRNFGLDLAQKYQATYIQFFDDDDVMHPTKLEKQVSIIDNDPSVDMVSCKYGIFKESIDFKEDIEMNVVSSQPGIDFLRGDIRINSISPIFKADLFDQERFDTSFHNYGEERELFLRILLFKEINYKAVEDYLFYYRHHDKSNTTSESSDIIKVGSNIRIFDKIWFQTKEQEHAPEKLIQTIFSYYLLSYYKKTTLEEIITYVNSRQYPRLLKYNLRSCYKWSSLTRKIFLKMIFR